MIKVGLMTSGRKNINISEETHARLNRLGLRGESFDDIIRKCIDAYEDKKGGKMSTMAHGWFRARNSIISVHGGLACFLPRAR